MLRNLLKTFLHAQDVIVSEAQAAEHSRKNFGLEECFEYLKEANHW